MPLSASYCVCQSLDHFPDPLFTFEEPSAPFTHLSPPTDIPDLSLFPTTDLHPNPNPTLTTLLVPTTVSEGTAGVPPVLSPPTGPSFAPHPNPQAGPHPHQPLVGPTPSWTPAPPTSTPPQQPPRPPLIPCPSTQSCLSFHFSSVIAPNSLNPKIFSSYHWLPLPKFPKFSRLSSHCLILRL